MQCNASLTPFSLSFPIRCNMQNMHVYAKVE